MSLYAWTLAPLILLHLWFARRNSAIFRFQILLDVVLAAVVGPALLTGNDLNPIRTIHGQPPFRHVEWSTDTGYQPTQGDLVYQFHPWWDETGRQLRRGEMPSIHPGVGAGLPLLANGQTGVLAPVMLPVWLHGPERGTTIMAFWKIELAGLGAFLFLLRPLRLQWTAAATGGVAWAGTPYLVGWLLVPLAWGVALLPWIWWAAWRLMTRSAPRWSVVAGGVGFGWLLGAGLHPETVAIVGGSALLLAFCLHPKRLWRVVGVAAVAGVVVMVLAWPTLGYISASSRVVILGDGHANREGLPISIKKDLVRQIAVPAAMGHPGRGDWKPAYPHAPGAAGVGGAVFVLLAAGRIRRRHRRFAVAAGSCAALGLILLVRIPPLDALLVRIPPIDHMTVPRFGVLIPWGLIVLASLGLDAAMRGRVRKTGARLAPAVVVLVLALWAAPWALNSVDAALVGLSVVAAAVAGFSRRWMLLPYLIVAELAMLGIGINPVASASDRLPRPPFLERLIELETANPSRVMGLGGALQPNIGSRYGLRDLRASDPLRPEPFARLMGVLGEPPTILGGPLRRAPAGLCGAWGVGLAVTKPDRTLPGWHREYGDRDGVIWSNPQLLAELRVVGRVIPEPDDPQTLVEFAEVVDFKTTALVGDGAQEVDATVMSLEVWRRTPTGVEATAECDGPCLVIVAQPWAPGWQGDVDGRRVDLVRTDIAGMGVVVPAGRHHLRLTYHPWRW